MKTMIDHLTKEYWIQVLEDVIEYADEEDKDALYDIIDFLTEENAG